MGVFLDEDDGVSPVIGVVLMVAITVALAAVVAIVVTSSGDKLTESNANAKISFDSHPGGLLMTIEHTSTDATVQLNGNDYADFSKDAAGKEILIPTTPGDSIAVVTGNKEQSALVTKQVEDRTEIGKFIASWQFEDADTSKAVDSSGQENDAEVDDGSPSISDGAATFDRSDSFLTPGALSTPGSVSKVTEFTLVYDIKPEDSTYNRDKNTGADSPHVSQHNGSPNFRPVLFPDRNGASNGDAKYSTHFGFSYTSPNSIVCCSEWGERNQFAFVWDGDTGNVQGYSTGGSQIQEGQGSNSEFSTLGEYSIGYNVRSGREYFDGKIYDLRIYYTAMDEGEINQILAGMGG